MFHRTHLRGAAFLVIGIMHLAPAAGCLAGRSAAPTPAHVAGPAAAGPVAVQVDWARGEGRAERRHYGLNLFQGFSNTSIGNDAYRANLDYMNPGLLRYHRSGTMKDSTEAGEGILDEKNRTWDAAKIKKALSLRLSGSPLRLINVPGWPSWMDADKDGFLDRDQFDAYADLLADLVRIVNRDGKLGVTYWEVTNEKDGRYYTGFYQDGGRGALKDPARPDRLEELIDIYNRCAVAMKRVDPGIKVGGPGAARPDLSRMHERFARGTLPNLDFFSFHAYASGSADTPDAQVYDRAEGIGKYARDVVATLRRVSPDRPIPVMLGEYNISWTWETRDPRMTSHKGAVFDALVLVNAVEGGAFSTQAWNEKDGVYGKTDGGDARRPSAHLFHLFNTYLVGDRVAAASGDPQAVAAYAVTQPRSKRRSLLLINRTDAAREVKAVFTGDEAQTAGPRTWTRSQIAEGGLTTRQETGTGAGGEGTWTLPAHSVTLLTGTP